MHFFFVSFLGKTAEWGKKKQEKTMSTSDEAVQKPPMKSHRRDARDRHCGDTSEDDEDDHISGSDRDDYLSDHRNSYSSHRSGSSRRHKHKSCSRSRSRSRSPSRNRDRDHRKRKHRKRKHRKNPRRKEKHRSGSHSHSEAHAVVDARPKAGEDPNKHEARLAAELVNGGSDAAAAGTTLFTTPKEAFADLQTMMEMMRTGAKFQQAFTGDLFKLVCEAYTDMRSTVELLADEQQRVDKTAVSLLRVANRNRASVESLAASTEGLATADSGVSQRMAAIEKQLAEQNAMLQRLCGRGNVPALVPVEDKEEDKEDDEDEEDEEDEDDKDDEKQPEKKVVKKKSKKKQQPQEVPKKKKGRPSDEAPVDDVVKTDDKQLRGLMNHCFSNVVSCTPATAAFFLARSGSLEAAALDFSRVPDPALWTKQCFRDSKPGFEKVQRRSRVQRTAHCSLCSQSQTTEVHVEGFYDVPEGEAATATSHSKQHLKSLPAAKDPAQYEERWLPLCLVSLKAEGDITLVDKFDTYASEPRRQWWYCTTCYHKLAAQRAGRAEFVGKPQYTQAMTFDMEANKHKPVMEAAHAIFDGKVNQSLLDALNL